jgi:type II secretory pathway pseudopilin PulG
MQALDVVDEIADSAVITAARRDVQQHARNGCHVRCCEVTTCSPRWCPVGRGGDEPGQLSQLFGKTAELYAVRPRDESPAVAAEPIMVSVTGTVVDGMVICPYMPMFRIYQNVRADRCPGAREAQPAGRAAPAGCIRRLAGSSEKGDDINMTLTMRSSSLEGWRHADPSQLSTDREWQDMTITRDDSGFMLLEVIVAMMIMSVTMASLGVLFGRSLTIISYQQDRQAAAQIATEGIDRLRTVAGCKLRDLCGSWWPDGDSRKVGEVTFARTFVRRAVIASDLLPVDVTVSWNGCRGTCMFTASTLVSTAVADPVLTTFP